MQYDVKQDRAYSTLYTSSYVTKGVNTPDMPETCFYLDDSLIPVFSFSIYPSIYPAKRVLSRGLNCSSILLRCLPSGK